MTVSFKGGVATFAAFFALFGGVQLAHAGIGDVVDEAASAAQDALPNPEETDLGNVVDEAVADPAGTAANVVEQADVTVENTAGAVKNIAANTPAGKAVTNVTKALDPVVSGSGKPSGLRKEQAAASGGSGARSEAAPRASKDIPHAQSNQAQSSKGPASPRAPSAAPEATFEVGPQGSIASSASALIDRNGAPPAQAGWMRPLEQLAASASAKPVKVPSEAPAVPFAPPPPGDQPATAASVAGAAGAALLAALFSALIFLAPRAGRLARPGPNLVRAEPCLSLPERPG